MTINVQHDDTAYIADPVITVKAGAVHYDLNFKSEYNAPSSDEGYNNFDPEFADGYEQAMIREKEFEND